MPVEKFGCASSAKSEQTRVVKIFGGRMREARVDICGYSQITAARLLGYSNSSKLAKIEKASDTNSIPLWLITRAAKVYDVSIDFLLGLSDDFERDPVIAQEREIGRWVHEHWEMARRAEVNAIRILANKVLTLERAVVHAMSRSAENMGALDKLRALNPEFDELKGGAKLLRLLTETADEAQLINNEFKRYKCHAGVAKQSENINLDIFGDGKAE